MRTRRTLWISAWALSLVFAGGCSSDGDEPAGPNNEPTRVDVTSNPPQALALSVAQIGPEGGTIRSSDLPGFEIRVPDGAVSETVTFEVSTVEFTAIAGLPDGVTPTGPIVRIQVDGSEDWNTFRMFEHPVEVTLPFVPPDDGAQTVRWYAIESDGSLEPTGFERIDADANTITFLTRTFADAAEPAALGSGGQGITATSRYAAYVAIGYGTLWAAWLRDGTTLDPGFRVQRDAWFIPNYGAYYEPSRGGNCMGMVTWAKYWFRRHGTGFKAKYHDPDDTSTWVDDATAIQLASRAHEAESNIWSDYSGQELSHQKPSSRAVALSWLGGLVVTRQPVLAGIYQAMRNAAGALSLKGGHAIMISGAKVEAGGEVVFTVYDPNYPKVDDASPRHLDYTDGVGFYVYLGGPSAAQPGYRYNYYKHFGYHLAVSDAAFDNLKVAADAGFADGSVFPKITIESITGKRSGEDVLDSEGVTDEGEHKYITGDNAVRIRGTVLGGQAQNAGSVVDAINVIVADQAFVAAVDNQAGGGTGAFSLDVPLYQGENDVVFLASKRNKFSHWAGFAREVIESAASRADLTITLSWAQGSSDVDLYVREPALAGGAGDTVYFRNRKSASATSPYLDLDNTSGYGPEHYYAEEGMNTVCTDGSQNPDGLYGSYDVRVHYYSDHDDDPDNIQPVDWTVRYRYLAFCPGTCEDPEAEGFWSEGGWHGRLSDASSGSCCNIDTGGSQWSQMFHIDYEAPEADDYQIPDPPSVMLP